MSTLLKKERHGAVMVWTLDQAETRNALTGNNAAEEFVQACAEVTRDTSVRAVVLTGAGPVFSSGGNVKDMQKYQGNTLPTEVIRDEYRNGIQRIPKALYPLDVPVIAAVNGPAIGAGLDLTCMCDIRIASEKATFAESFVRVGIVPGDGGAWLLPRVVGMSKACEMAFTGEALNAAQALACTRAFGLPDDSEKVNPNGGAIALGHPLGMSGARLVLTASRQLQRTGQKRAICSMCVGVGQGMAILLERV